MKEIDQIKQVINDWLTGGEDYGRNKGSKGCDLSDFPKGTGVFYKMNKEGIFPI